MNLVEAFQKYNDDTLMRRKSAQIWTQPSSIGHLKKEKTHIEKNMKDLGFVFGRQMMDDIRADDWEEVNEPL